MRHEALAADRIAAVETGGCPHTAVRDDVSQNLDALGQLMERFGPDLLFVESGGDNLAAQFSRELADFTIYVIDVSGGDKIPRKGGPGITQSDLLVINKTDLAPLIGADLEVMARDSRRMRGDGPFLFAQVKHGVGVRETADGLLQSWRRATGARSAALPMHVSTGRVYRVRPERAQAVPLGHRTTRRIASAETRGRPTPMLPMAGRAREGHEYGVDR